MLPKRKSKAEELSFEAAGKDEYETGCTVLSKVTGHRVCAVGHLLGWSELKRMSCCVARLRTRLHSQACERRRPGKSNAI
jgi:hypothetical protein